MTRLRIFRSLDEARGAFPASTVTIGNFDGVHIGHRELMRRTVQLGRELEAKPSALTFHPHPKTIVAPERAPRLLTTPEERCALMSECGIEQVLILPFDRAVSHLTPSGFVDEILNRTLGARAVVVGDNFRFGKRQAGGAADLRAGCGVAGIRAEIVPLLACRGVAASSSEIRRLLEDGRVSAASRLLDRPYSIAGDVVPGEGRGSRHTVPTLNLETSSLDDSSRALPRDGVYVTRTEDLDSARRWNSITNAGYRPTFSGRHLTIETFLFGELVGPAPLRIRVEFLRRLREERRFDSAEALKAQILSDIEVARAFFRRLDHFKPSLMGRRR